MKLTMPFPAPPWVCREIGTPTLEDFALDKTVNAGDWVFSGGGVLYNLSGEIFCASIDKLCQTNFRPTIAHLKIMFGAVRVSPTLVHFELAAGIGFGGTGLAVDFGVAVEFGVAGTAPSFNTPRQVYDFPFIWTT